MVVSFPAERSVARPCAEPRLGSGHDPFDAREVAEAERLEVRRAKTADRAGRVPERVGAAVAVRVGIRRVADPPRIADDEEHAGHQRVGTSGSPLLLAVDAERAPTAALRAARDRSASRNARRRRTCRRRSARGLAPRRVRLDAKRLHDRDEPGPFLRAVRAVGEPGVVDERHLVAVGVGALLRDLPTELGALLGQGSPACARRAPPRSSGSTPSGRPAPRARMRRVVHLTEVVFGHQRVDLRGGDARVPEQLLHDADVGASLQQVGREGVPERVERYPTLDPGGLDRGGEQPGAALSRQPAALAGSGRAPHGSPLRRTSVARARGRRSPFRDRTRPGGPPAPSRPCRGPGRSPPPGPRRRRRARPAPRSAVPLRTAPRGWRGLASRRAWRCRAPPGDATTSSNGSGCGSERGSFGCTMPAAGSRSVAPSRSRNRWNDRTDESVRATESARCTARSSSPQVDAEIDATKDRMVGSSTSPGSRTSRFVQNAT